MQYQTNGDFSAHPRLNRLRIDSTNSAAGLPHIHGDHLPIGTGKWKAAHVSPYTWDFNKNVAGLLGWAVGNPVPAGLHPLFIS